jgi:hypothetical protein
MLKKIRTLINAKLGLCGKPELIPEIFCLHSFVKKV